MENSKTKRLTISAVMMALALAVSFVCSLIPFLNLPFGGGFTIAGMLPIVLIAYMYGTKWGLLTAFSYSILQMLISIRTVSAFFMPASDDYAGSAFKALAICLLDYVIAYTLLGLGGIFRNKIKNKTTAIAIGTVIAILLRYLTHIISGYIFFGAWAEWFFSQEGFYTIGRSILNTFSGNTLSAVYSVFYNGLYMLPELLITTIIAVPVSKLSVIKKYQI